MNRSPRKNHSHAPAGVLNVSRMQISEQRIELASMDPKQVAEENGDFIVRQVLEMEKTGGAMGLSGGRGQHFAWRR